MLLTTLLVYVFSFILAYYVLQWFWTRNESSPKLPPCLAHLPIIGSLFMIWNFKNASSYLMNKSKKLGDIIAFYMCNKYVIVLNGKKSIHEAFVKHSLNFSDRPPFFSSLNGGNPKRKGIVEHPYNEDFKFYHNLSLNILKQFGFGQGIMESRIAIEVENLVQRIKMKNSQCFDPNFEITAAVSNVISSIIFGKRWSIDDPEFLEGIEIVHLLVHGFAETMIIECFPILRYLPIFKEKYQQIFVNKDKWEKFYSKVLNRVLDDKSIESFCNVYIESMKNLRSDKDVTNSLDMEQLKYTVRDLFTGGTDTTATSLRWFIYFMANCPQVQERLKDELLEKVGSKRFPTLEDKQNLPLMEAAILEIMRIKTLASLGQPHLTTKDIVINGILIPKDVTVMANLYSVHMDSDVWDEPEQFKIERFLSEDCKSVINKDKIIPFSLGKRSCMGEILARQEIFLFASALIQQFQILPPDGQNEITTGETLGVVNFPLPFEARLISRM